MLQIRRQCLLVPVFRDGEKQRDEVDEQVSSAADQPVGRTNALTGGKKRETLWGGRIPGLLLVECSLGY
jgi:hypothetical protein